MPQLTACTDTPATADAVQEAIAAYDRIVATDGALHGCYAGMVAMHVVISTRAVTLAQDDVTLAAVVRGVEAHDARVRLGRR